MEIVRLNTSEDFYNLISKHKLVVVDFYAEWCGPCKLMKPLLKELARKYTEVKFAEIDADNCEKLVKRLKINAVPTLIFFRNGKEVSRHIGLANIQAIDKWISGCVNYDSD